MGRRGGIWVIAQAALLLMFVFSPAMGPAWGGHELVRLAGWLLIGAGSILLVWSAFNLGRSFTPFPRPLSDGKLVTSGSYSLVRHPIYSAAILGLLGLALVSENWLRLALTGILFIFFDLKARREESWLREQYPQYQDYALKVKKLIPFIY